MAVADGTFSHGKFPLSFVAKAPADGYTLLVNTSAQAYSAALLKNLPYDPLKESQGVPITFWHPSRPRRICATRLRSTGPIQ